MPYFISGVTADHKDLVARTPEEFRSLNGIDVRTRHRVLEIEPGKMRVKVADLDGGREFYADYTRLLLATGARAFAPPVDGVDLGGCFLLRKLEDSIRIKEFLKERKPRRAVVVGAGPIGVEMCESFRSVGLEVSLLEMANQVMPYMDPDLAARVQSRLEQEGVNCLLGQGLEGLEGDAGGRVRRVVTSGGHLDCDMVLLGIGIRPVSGVGEAAGAKLGARGAISIDRQMRTSVPGIYAAGDCATTFNTLTGQETWLPLGSTARKQGRLAADNMFGGRLEFGGVQGTSIVKCFDLTIGRTGLNETEARAAGFDPAEITMEAENLHEFFPGRGSMAVKLLADRAGGRLLGAQLVGELASAADKRLDIFAVAITAGLTAGDLQYLDLAYAPPYSTAVDVPIIAGNLMVGRIEGKTCSCGPYGLE
jgi:NADPH-dependent 2,4-dienoyl-CoA reductase/sulfur reductase-like enzyme